MEVGLLWGCWIFLFTAGVLIISAEIKNEAVGCSDSLIVFLENCEEAAEKILRALLPYSRRLGMRLLVVDDYSCDMTPQILIRLQQDYPWIKVIDRKGAASKQYQHLDIDKENTPGIKVVDFRDFSYPYMPSGFIIRGLADFLPCTSPRHA